MIIRLGYVAISKALDITSSGIITYTNYLKEENKDEKLDKIIKSNLDNLEKILNYNVKNNIHFYRLTSKLIPLATHKDVSFEYINKYKDYYNKISLPNPFQNESGRDIFTISLYFLISRDFPVISFGCSIPISSIRVGAMSARHPPSLNV